MNNDTKSKYAEAFEELLKSNSYDKININDICAKCGTHRPNFYYHFKSKNDLAEWIFDQDFYLMKESTDNTLSNQTVLLENMQDHRIFYLKTLGERASCSLHTYIKGSITSYICRLNNTDENDIDEIIKFKLDYMSSAWVMTIHAWLAGAFEMSSENFSKMLYESMYTINHKDLKRGD